jgi:hypothetical protein
VQRQRKDERDLDVDEENWFNDETDDNKITSLNHGSDDEDSQPEISSAISTSEPTSLLDNDDDDDDDDDNDDVLPSSSRSHYNKPSISIHIRHSPIPSSSTTVQNDSITFPADISSTSPYAMVRKKEGKSTL